MSSRRQDRRAARPAGGAPEGEAPSGAVDPALDLLTAEAGALLAGWPRRDQILFAELMEDAPSEIQREMLWRALSAGHSAAELHAFGDALRPLSDREVFEACTLAGRHGRAVPVADRLQAEADPVFAFVQNGHPLTPRGSERGPSFPALTSERMRAARLPPGMMLEPPVAPVVPRRVLEDARGSEAPARRPAPREPSEGPSPPPGSGAGRFAEDLFNEAVKPLGLSFVEEAVDVGGLSLEEALAEGARALLHGVPLPVVLGRAPGDFRRYALLLQVQSAGSSRAFQIHDPFIPETVWAHERDLLGRTELPLSNGKVHRRITAIALPR